MSPKPDLGTVCSHCGDDCLDDRYHQNNESFCCNGCQMVYSLLHENGMSDYYRYEAQPGISQKLATTKSYEYLDNNEIIDRLIGFSEGGISKVTFLVPQIHCSSCLWLLENLNLLESGVIKSTVNFSSKKATITYRDGDTSLRKIVELLARIGYEPEINYDQLDEKKSLSSFDRQLILKLGVAGFCFGNIMLLSFPEYLGFNRASKIFHIGYINILLAIPVLLYSGIDYLKSAYKGIKLRDFNIDLPIALGMLALFGRSLYEIIGQHGEGYLDSFSGFIFFLLIGRWFQAFTYRSLDFDRNYKSYFPISANVFVDNEWISKSLDHLRPGDILRIRNQELIPADSILQKGHARIDYSFVTGESDLISKHTGDQLFAGGRHQGESIDIVVTKKVDQSYLTQLWNEDTFHQKEKSNSSKLISGISKYFTFVVIGIALLTMLYWMTVDVSLAFNTFTAVLIVACPCALALAIPFTYGNILRLLSTTGFYLRNVQTIENLQDIDYIIFDKTGTITDSKNIEISYHGKSLTSHQRTIIKSACSHSSHPLSMAIVKELKNDDTIDVDQYQDVIGSGLVAKCCDSQIKLGSSAFIFGSSKLKKEQGVFIEIDGVYIGYYKFKHAFREGVEDIMNNLGHRYKVAVLSGDTDQENDRIKSLLNQDAKAYFNQSPKDKLEKIKSLQEKGHNVMMIGDGLNDAGALKQANVGLVISDEANNFSPACDGIIDASKFSKLYNQLAYLSSAKYIIYGAFALAFLYNSIGLYFAMSGQLSPVIAAILMPLSSITVIVYGVVLSWALYGKSQRK
jgi:Cu+-exporting ATPase